MPIEVTVTAYQCKSCKKNHLEIKKAQTCEKVCTSKIREIKRMRVQKSKAAELANMATSPKHIEELLPKYLKEFYGVEVVRLALSATYKESLSNTHHCPVNGTTNWIGDSDLPRGYPGFYGKIAIEAKEGKGYKKFDSSMLGNDNLNSMFLRDGIGTSLKGINTGSGGGGGIGSTGVAWYRYELYIFIDDFPLIKREINRLKLQGKPPSALNHSSVLVHL